MNKLFIIVLLLIGSIIPTYANDLGKILGGLVAGYIIYEALDQPTQPVYHHYYVVPPPTYRPYYMPPPPPSRYYEIRPYYDYREPRREYRPEPFRQPPMFPFGHEEHPKHR